jgi:hypothetical protein
MARWEAAIMTMGLWDAGRWYRVLDDDGKLWMETSDPQEARDEAIKTGYRLERLWVRTEYEWRSEETRNPGHEDPETKWKNTGIR